MGWLKKVFKPLAKAVDPILPEPVKKFADKSIGGIPLLGLSSYVLRGENGGKMGSAPAAPTIEAPPQQDTTGRLTQTEIDANLEQSKKMARLGKYFTSPLGALSTASTAGQKVFS